MPFRLNLPGQYYPMWEVWHSAVGELRFATAHLGSIKRADQIMHTKEKKRWYQFGSCHLSFARVDLLFTGELCLYPTFKKGLVSIFHGY
jgi:hypothetical protein